MLRTFLSQPSIELMAKYIINRSFIFFHTQNLSIKSEDSYPNSDDNGQGDVLQPRDSNIWESNTPCVW